MKFDIRGILMVAGFSLAVVIGGCAGTRGPGGVRDKDNPYAFLDDAAMDKFDDDLHDLQKAIERGDAPAEVSLRRAIGEQARQYQSALISALNDNSSMQRRRMASIVLGFTGDASVVGPLMLKVEEDEPESVRHMAVLGLATLDRKLRDFPKHADLMAVLRRVMENKDTSASMRRSAVQAYAAAYDRVLNDSISPLRDRFVSDKDLGVQVASVNALGDIGDKAATTDLIGVGLSHPSSEIRLASAISLGKIQDSRVIVPALVISASDDENTLVRREAVNSLTAHFASDPDVVFSALMLGLTDFGDGVREAAALALARTKDSRAIDPLLQATGDRTAIVRRAAADGLGNLLTKEKEVSAFPLVDLLADQTPAVRASAQKSLVKITTRDFGDDQSKWRGYFYVTYKELDPANAYVGKPKPRMTSNITGGGGRTSSSRPSTGRSTSGTRPSSSGTRPSSSGTRTSGTGTRGSGTTPRRN